jgi:hypothetical protein
METQLKPAHAVTRIGRIHLDKGRKTGQTFFAFFSWQWAEPWQSSFESFPDIVYEYPDKLARHVFDIGADATPIGKLQGKRVILQTLNAPKADDSLWISNYPIRAAPVLLLQNDY